MAQRRKKGLSRGRRRKGANETARVVGSIGRTGGKGKKKKSSQVDSVGSENGKGRHDLLDSKTRQKQHIKDRVHTWKRHTQ